MKKKREREGGGGIVERVERERERRREVGRAASERTVKPPFERNRLGDEFEREGEGRFEGGAAGVVTNTEMVKVY